MPNLKELRFAVDRNPWRIAFAFDRARVAILLCGGRKSGIAEARFYERLIGTAEARWLTHEE